MTGRFSVKSSEGFWLLVDKLGKDWYATDPAAPEPATSYFGKKSAEQAMQQFGLPSIATVLDREGFENFAAMRAAGNQSVCWAVVPDPNP